jgi:DNA-binding Lrp family transcriptional regulator
MSEWTIGAYRVFKDIDTYTILIYLISKQFDFYRRNNLNITYNNFYKDKSLEIEKINLINISKDLQIPKESVRRKVLTLEKNGIIKKKGKKFSIDRSAYNSTQPIDTLKNISALLSVFSKILKDEKVVKNEMSSYEINSLIKSNFSFCWYQFYKFLFPYCLRWKIYFGDMEIFTILATIILNNNSKINRQLKGIDSYLQKWRNQIINQKIKGINAMSISEITGIPRPTVVRKIQILTKNKFISLDKNKLINFDVSNKNFKEMSKIQDENLSSLNYFIKRTFNQINLN